MISILTVILYSLAIISCLFANSKKTTLVLISLGLLSALYSFHIQWVSLPFLLAIIFSSYGLFRLSKYRALFVVLYLLTGTLAYTYAIPGINNWFIVKDIILSEGAIPHSIYFWFDISLIGFSTLLFGVKKEKSIKDLIIKLKPIVKLIPIMLFSIISLSLIMNYVVWDPKSTVYFWPWALSNLLFTCVTEEAIFRRFFQDGFKTLFKNNKYKNTIAITLASLLFGLAHFAGGIKYIILASIAGGFYGYAYHKTKRIEASICCHFILNSIHFLLFTYPVLESAI